MLLGLVVGFLAERDASWLGEIGKLVIQLIKVMATPLLFLAVVNAVLHNDVSGRSGARMVVIALVNASIALAVGLMVSNIFEPGHHLDLHGDEARGRAPDKLVPIDFGKTLTSYIPTSLVQPFLDNAIIPLVLFALFFGFALRRVRREGAHPRGVQITSDLLAAMLRVAEVSLTWIITLIPLAVFAVVAKSVGEYGLRPIVGLGAYVLAGVGGLALHAAVTYHLWLVLYVRMPLRRFWRAAKDPVVYAMGANSSLATLPVTLQALDRLGVSKGSSTLGACVGTNLNNDGIILYEAMAVLFVAQAHGIHLDAGQQLLAIVSCMVAAMGIAGVPEAGFISLSIVLATVGLPVELLPILLTVDWIIARGRSVVNVLSDMLVSIILDRWSGRRFDASP
ncbi:MAG: dicarboxylate/amino acid:cation symporter [Deltaproteobacteria bacterium]|nr:dicarboxylate/amino acid:cation symporter [Deltaproteobacteria bacterium]